MKPFDLVQRMLMQNELNTLDQEQLQLRIAMIVAVNRRFAFERHHQHMHQQNGGAATLLSRTNNAPQNIGLQHLIIPGPSPQYTSRRNAIGDLLSNRGNPIASTTSSWYNRTTTTPPTNVVEVLPDNQHSSSRSTVTTTSWAQKGVMMKDPKDAGNALKEGETRSGGEHDECNTTRTEEASRTTCSPSTTPAVHPVAGRSLKRARHSPTFATEYDEEQEVETRKTATADANGKNTSGIPPKPKSNKWLDTLEELKLYKEKHGDCIVPRGYSENPRLGSWVAEQRKQYKLLKSGKPSSITPDRVALLNKLGFAWNAQEAAWSRHIEDLRQFRLENGHCHVPLNHDKYPKLGLWVKEQRRHFALMKQGKQSHMNEERARVLASVGFCWDTHEATWMERLGELAEFKARYGTCSVPTGYVDNPRLGTWVHHQRQQYKKFMRDKNKNKRSSCHITAARIQALESLGFLWHPREPRRGGGAAAPAAISSAESSVVDLSSSDATSICSLESDSNNNDVAQQQHVVDLRLKKRPHNS